ncbi:MAG: hydrogenase maturation nickel metallochaperone HypA [Eubacteriales bacterium]|nr:hydrogenase maturation nickel metallochaperone HypA [Eubacteriales bacterium]
MHETSLVQFTLNAVEHRAAGLGITRVKSIQLVTGELRGALPNLMQAAFRTLKRNRPIFEDAVLEMKVTPVILKCRDCGTEYQKEDFHDVRCPKCGITNFEIISGSELYIESFEGE